MKDVTSNVRPGTAISRSKVAEDFAALGLREGDILYLRCGLSKVGIRSKDVEDIFIGGIRDALGPRGTLISPAFGPMSLRWQRDPVRVNRETPPTTGAFAKILLKQPNAVRSPHPTHSFVGIGIRAAEILETHPPEGACFEPLRAIVAEDALMALVGCVAESPGFSTVHLAQWDLGLSQRHYLKWLFAVRDEERGGKVFHPIESPGCSDNFGVFYKDYVESGNFASGQVGNAWSIAVRARAAYERERMILARNPRYTICERPDCLSCRTTRGYNKRAIPAALVHRALQKLRPNHS